MGKSRNAGKDNPNYGKHRPCSEETKNILSKKAKERFKNPENHPMYGTHRNREDCWIFGKKHSKETKEKISQTRIRLGIAKGKKNPMYGSNRVGILNPMYNKFHSPRAKKRIGQAIKLFRMLHPNFRKGKNHPNWRGGIGKEPYPFYFDNQLKEQIRKRDNYTCRKCGIKQEDYYRKLDIHHIDYDKENLNPINLISLCQGCNIKVNFSRAYWKKYFEERLCESVV